jgi:hypothetical protein
MTENIDRQSRPVVGRATRLSGGVSQSFARLDRRDTCPTTAAASGFTGSKRELLIGRILSPLRGERGGIVRRNPIEHA